MGVASVVRGRAGNDTLSVLDFGANDTINGGAGFDSCSQDLVDTPPLNCP